MTFDGVQAVQARIARAARQSGRDLSSITVIAVTKGFEWRYVEPIVRGAGLLDVGESRVQELRAKQKDAGRSDIRWHMIGTLQRNKVKDVAGRVSLIHSVDSVELATAIGARAQDARKRQGLLLEVNTSGEATKHGLDPDEVEAAASEVAALEGVHLRGLMTMAAPGDRAAARRAFALLRRLRDTIAERYPEARELSMGMSEDLEEAVAEGATMLRVGTAIFGARPIVPGSDDGEGVSEVVQDDAAAEGR